MITKTRMLLLGGSMLSALAPWCSPVMAREPGGQTILAQQDTSQDKKVERREQRQEQRQQQKPQQQKPQQQKPQPQKPQQQKPQQQKPQQSEQRAQPQPVQPQPKPSQPQGQQPQPKPQPQGQPHQQPQQKPPQPQSQQPKPPRPERPSPQSQPPHQQQSPQPQAPQSPRQPQSQQPAQPPRPQAQTPPQREPRREDARDRNAQPSDAHQNARRIEDLRKERKETKEGNRTVIREGDRTIVRQDNRTIIRHDDVNRFRLGSRDVKVERQGADTRTIVNRPNGVQIVNVVDGNGRLLRRIRRDKAGHEVVIIDNRPRAGRAVGVILNIRPPVIRIPRERYIVEAENAPPALLFETLEAPPVDQIERAYTLDEVLDNPNLRAQMRRVDLDTITFDTGSWEVASTQAARLEPLAHAMQQAIAKNNAEVFLVEGHTDAVGDDVDNLTLSDRRAEAVAVVLSEKFSIPPENLTTQGYGEQQLKVQTQGPERQNRRVSVRRITPLLAGGGSPASGG